MSMLLNLLPIISMIYPPAAPIIGILTTIAPYAIAAEPLVVAAIKEGLPALQAAEAAAPQFTAQIKALAAQIPTELSSAFSHGGSVDAIAENLARMSFSFPKMTPEQELKWMNDMTPGNDPSQENSKFTIG